MNLCDWNPPVHSAHKGLVSWKGVPQIGCILNLLTLGSKPKSDARYEILLIIFCLTNPNGQWRLRWAVHRLYYPFQREYITHVRYTNLVYSITTRIFERLYDTAKIRDAHALFQYLPKQCKILMGENILVWHRLNISSIFMFHIFHTFQVMHRPQNFMSNYECHGYNRVNIFTWVLSETVA